MKDDLITLKELQDLLPGKPSKHSIYGWTFRKEIPFYRYGKKLFFSKSEILEWNENGRPKSKN